MEGGKRWKWEMAVLGTVLTVSGNWMKGVVEWVGTDRSRKRRGSNSEMERDKVDRQCIWTGKQGRT